MNPFSYHQKPFRLLHDLRRHLGPVDFRQAFRPLEQLLQPARIPLRRCQQRALRLFRRLHLIEYRLDVLRLEFAKVAEYPDAAIKLLILPAAAQVLDQPLHSAKAQAYFRLVMNSAYDLKRTIRKMFRLVDHDHPPRAGQALYDLLHRSVNRAARLRPQLVQDLIHEHAHRERGIAIDENAIRMLETIMLRADRLAHARAAYYHGDVAFDICRVQGFFHFSVSRRCAELEPG